MKIGVFGYGHVGGTMARAFGRHHDVYVYDPEHPPIATDDALTHASDCELVFICVPTPTLPCGTVDLTLVEWALAHCHHRGLADSTIVIRSTVPPLAQFPEMKPGQVLHMPEFLSRRTADSDFRGRKHLVVGGKFTDIARRRIVEAFAPVTPHAVLHWATWELAALLKYAVNGFGAAKVSYFSEVAAIAEGLGVDYRELRELVLLDPRIHTEWTQIPGHDGEPGYGGPCLPKDARALLRMAEDLGAPSDVLQAMVRWARCDF